MVAVRSQHRNGKFVVRGRIELENGWQGEELHAHLGHQNQASGSPQAPEIYQLGFGSDLTEQKASVYYPLSWVCWFFVGIFQELFKYQQEGGYGFNQRFIRMIY